MDLWLLTAALLVGLLAHFVQPQVSFSCAENACEKVTCQNIECEEPYGRLLKNATKCGCCHWCVKQLAEGEECSTKQVASLPGAECGRGLTCSDKRCRKMQTTCMKNLRRHIAKYGSNDLTTGPPRPHCDNFGYYSAVQCKEGTMCYCVNPEGDRIFGSAPYSEKNKINCNCSREYEKFKDKLEDETYFLRCTESGNYDNIQCTNSSCFCIDENGEIDGRILEADRPTTQLRCFKEATHFEYFLTPCYAKLREAKEQIKKYSEDGFQVIGIEIPNCDIDGSYAPVQCSGKTCNCVNKKGEPYRGTSIARKDRHLARCNCIREKDLLEKEMKSDPVSNLFTQYTCDSHGNYSPIQCVASVCYCVDKDGFQVNDSVLLSERSLLKCT